MSAQWFHDSVETGYSMPEADYDVDKEGQAGGGREGGGEGVSASGTSRKRYVMLTLNFDEIERYVLWIKVCSCYY